MARNGDVNIGIHGDSSDAQRAMEEVSSGASDMGRDVRRATEDSESGFDRLGEGIDGSERRFRGLGDTIGGTGDIMQGFKDGNVIGLAMGFADLAGGVTDFIIPALTAMSGFITSTLIPALTAVATHPLFLAVLAAGAIIVGLVLLEKKFGLVSAAIDKVKEAAQAVWNWFKQNWDLLLPILLGPVGAAITVWRRFGDEITSIVGGVVTAIKNMWNATIGGKGFTFGGVDLPGPIDIPGIDLRIPKLHSGGVVMGSPASETLALLQGGERVVPNGAGASGVTIVVQGSLVLERDLPALVARAGRQAVLEGALNA